MKAIFKNELKSYFTTPVGYVFIGIFIFLTALSFVYGPLSQGYADISIMFENIIVIYMFIVPLLTMRLIAEEKNKKTDQLLLTAPVKVWEIVAGKFFAALAVFMASAALTLLFPAVLARYGQLAVGETICAYIGVILVWSAFISLGLFISCMTESQMIAGAATIAVLLCIFFIDSIAGNSSNAVLIKITDWFSILKRYSEFQYGVINIGSVVYYISFTLMFLFLSVRLIEKKRYI